MAIHQIAVHIVGLDISLHKDDEISSWAPPKDDDPDFFWSTFPNGPPPTLFLHRSYRAYDQYPDGAADAVGYWAEGRILGGVALFDKRDPDAELNLDANPHRVEVCFTLTHGNLTSAADFFCSPTQFISTRTENR